MSGTYAILTPDGRGAVAVVGVRDSNPDRWFGRLFRPVTQTPPRVGQIRLGTWRGGETVVLVVVASDRYEIQCHGGVAAVDQIVRDLRDEGLGVCEDVSRWCLGTGADRFHHDNVRVLSGCLTDRTAAIALRQVRGALSRWLMEVPKMTVAQRRRSGGSILAAAPWTTRLARRWTVVLTGPPNVGKSSLMNALAGYERSIVLDRPGTTRDALRTDTVLDGIAIELIDTAGRRSTTETIEAEGVRRGEATLGWADLIVSVGDPDSPPDPTPAGWEATILVRNKSDLIVEDGLPSDPNVLNTSARTGEGIERLKAAIAEAITGGVDPSDAAVLTDAQADAVREALASDADVTAEKI